MYIATQKSYADSPFVAPYIDGRAQGVEIETAYIANTSSKYLRIVNSGQYACTNTDGSADERSVCTCEDCGARVPEDDERYAVGLHEDRTVGECCIDDYTMVTGRSGNEYRVPDAEAVGVDGEWYHREYLSDNDIVELENGDYCKSDYAVYINDDWYHVDDETVIRDHAGDYQLCDDCVALHDGEWALGGEAWECAGSGNWYLFTDDDPVEVDGDLYHEDNVPADPAQLALPFNPLNPLTTQHQGATQC